MSLYARADVVSVSVPVTSGGCGQTHIRPVANGAPVRVWKLDCPQCEEDLRRDIARSGAKKVRTVNSDFGMKLAERYLGLWGTRNEMVPETPDEEKEREYAEQETARHQAKAQTDAFAAMALNATGNQEVLAKMAELLMSMAQAPVTDPDRAPDVPVPAADIAPAAPPCMDCGKPVVRISAKGPAPKRCPDCKPRRAAA